MFRFLSRLPAAASDLLARCSCTLKDVTGGLTQIRTIRIHFLSDQDNRSDSSRMHTWIRSESRIAPMSCRPISSLCLGGCLGGSRTVCTSLPPPPSPSLRTPLFIWALCHKFPVCACARAHTTHRPYYASARNNARAAGTSKGCASAI